MDSKQELRTAVLAILKAQTRLRAEQAWLRGLFLAIAASQQKAAIALPLQEDHLDALYTQEQKNTARLCSAIGEGQPFAALLQEYVSQPEVPLIETIRASKVTGFR